jgi:sugar lactone lactonase YvrE
MSIVERTEEYMFNRRLGLKANLKSRFGLATLACVGLAIAISTPAAAWERGSVETFALIPSGFPMVEGLTVGPDGKVYTATFNPGGSGPAQLFTFGPQGNLLASVPIMIQQQGLPPKPSSPAILGLEVIPKTTNKLLVLDFGAGDVLLVDPTSDPTTGNATLCITLPSGFTKGSGLNGITFDKQGNVYFSDSFQGIIWTFSPPPGGSICGAGPVTASVWASDPIVPGTPPTGGSLLPSNENPPKGVPPFGANGIEFNSKFDTMFVCNTAMDWIVKIPVETDGKAGKPTVFTNSINGCDGLRLDSNDNIWAAANQSDEIVVVNPNGKAIAKLGDFDGIEGGVTSGLLFPASPAFSKDGQSLFVTNLELDLRKVTGDTTVDSDWTDQVKQHSIARVEAQIPQQGGNQ